MTRKIISKKRLNWAEEDRFKLNYQMLFADKASSSEKKKPARDPRVEQEERARAEEKIRTESFEKGLAEGHREGLETARMEMDKRFSELEKHYVQAQNEWLAQQEQLKPGLIQLVFDICEAILGVPVTHASMRNKLEHDLEQLFQELDKKSKAVLWVSADDYVHVEKIHKKYAGSTGVMIRASKNCLPGEYQLETNREKLVRDFREMLNDFRESLFLPD